jgi:hypothetical protein
VTVCGRYDRGTAEKQNILSFVFALTLCIQLSLIISFLVIDSHAKGSTSTNHGDGHIGISNVKD